MTLHFSRASWRAVSLPIPELEPVTRTVLFSSFMIFSPFSHSRSPIPEDLRRLQRNPYISKRRDDAGRKVGWRSIGLNPCIKEVCIRGRLQNICTSHNMNLMRLSIQGVGVELHFHTTGIDRAECNL